MPPSRKSSSSHSSRSHRSSSSHRSSGGSSSRHSSSSHSSRSSSSVYMTRKRTNQPTRVPRQIRKNAISLSCRYHDYVFYDTPWQDEKTGIFYPKGYYDETGRYYDANNIAFKRPDGSYTAHYTCPFCGTEFENTWQEGVYPVCQNCGAQMEKQPVFIDEIVHIGKYGENKSNGVDSHILIGAMIPVAFFLIIFFWTEASFRIQMVKSIRDGSSSHVDNEVTNLDIYGDRIYLIDIGNQTYEICDSDDVYDKCLEWDYGADSYYDYESNCYLWYNTDVAPNLWQYWYDDIAGDNYYGWMECENGTWYIETSDTEWTEYTGDTSNLWHIQNRFDE